MPKNGDGEIVPDGGSPDRIVVIGGSAGSLEVLRQITERLPKDLPAAVFIVQHSSPMSPSLLPRILERDAVLPVEFAHDREPIQQGRIYVAPPDFHLVVKRKHMRVVRGPKENSFRPAVDPLFRSAARAHGPAVIAVVLSGGLDDGSYGMAVVKRAGGIAIVQDIDEALVPSMPLRVCQTVEVDHIAKGVEIGPLINQLSRQPIQLAEGTGMSSEEDELEPDVAEYGFTALESETYSNAPSSFTCPECGGALWEMGSDHVLRYRCHVGHGYTADSLIMEQSHYLEAALWTALRALEENAELHRRMADRAHEAKLTGLVAGFRERAEHAEDRADVIRGVLLKGRAESVESSDSNDRHSGNDRQMKKPKKKSSKKSK